MMVTLPPDYRPSDDEEFMNPIQVEYFRQKLLRWRADLLREADGTLASLSEGGIHEADITDRASVETDRALELRTRDRARKLISKIDQALMRIENGTYGYCEETGEPIGLRRLEARADRHPVDRGAGAPRAHGARPPRRLSGAVWSWLGFDPQSLGLPAPCDVPPSWPAKAVEARHGDVTMEFAWQVARSGAGQPGWAARYRRRAAFAAAGAAGHPGGT